MSNFPLACFAHQGIFHFLKKFLTFQVSIKFSNDQISLETNFDIEKNFWISIAEKIEIEK